MRARDLSSSFSALPTPALDIGAGACLRAIDWMCRAGPLRVLFVRGQQSLDHGDVGAMIVDALNERGCEVSPLRVEGEPCVQWFEDRLVELRAQGIEAVLAVGGGSVLDVGKGMAGMLAAPGCLLDYLEGVGRGLAFPGRRLPLICVPTSSGTGSEATSNAVFGESGAHGYKKSLRHASLVPDRAALDPALLVGMSRPQTAACGMDALTQCVESLLSTKATQHSDAYARRGIVALHRGLRIACEEPGNASARLQCALGAYCSGVALAHAGLGVVHGFAPLLGAQFGVPHGVACGRPMAAANRVNLAVLRAREPDHPALLEYAWLGQVLSDDASLDVSGGCDAAIAELERLTIFLDLPRLSSFGLARGDLAGLCTPAINRNNPVALTDAELWSVLDACL